MKKVNCDYCGKINVPQNETVEINEKVCCEDCIKEKFGDKDLQKRLKINKNLDPTICSNCNKDFGDKVLEKISDYPICDECLVKIRNKTFPSWLKYFLIGIAALIIFSLFWNFRFFISYHNIKKTNISLSQGDYEEAAKLMESASTHVPEIKELRTLSAYYKGISLLYMNKSSEALAEFEKCKNDLPSDYPINSLINQAKMGKGFDTKDYNLFLLASLENLKADNSIAMSNAMVASAYACKYVENGTESFKDSTLKYLNKAESIDDTTKEILNYYNRIEHRLYTKVILNKTEFDKKYPNGWNKKSINY